MKKTETRRELPGDAADNSHDAPLVPPRDLIDFHLRWREFRPFADSALQAAVLTPAQRETLMWLIALADRISPEDVT